VHPEAVPEDAVLLPEERLNVRKALRQILPMIVWGTVEREEGLQR